MVEGALIAALAATGFAVVVVRPWGRGPMLGAAVGTLSGLVAAQWRRLAPLTWVVHEMARNKMCVILAVIVVYFVDKTDAVYVGGAPMGPDGGDLGVHCGAVAGWAVAAIFACATVAIAHIVGCAWRRGGAVKMDVEPAMEDKLGEGFEEYGERLDSLESLSPRGECGLFKMDGVLSRLHENAKIHDFRGPGGEVG